jgi:hypothetical protein
LENSQNFLMRQDAQRSYLEQQAIMNQQKNAELQRYQAQTPYQLMQDSLKGNQAQAQNTPGYLQQYAEGEAGKAMSFNAKGRGDMATWESGAAKTNMENVAASLEAAGRQLEMAAANSPLMAQPQWQELRSKLPKQLQGQFPEQYSPDVPKMISQLSKTIMDNPAHRRDMQGRQLTADTATAVGKGHDDASRYGADQRLSAAYARLPSQTRAKLENVLAEIAEKVAKGQATPQDRETAMWIQSMMYNIRGASTANTMDPKMIEIMLLGLQAQNRGVPAPVAPPGPQPVPPPSGLTVNEESVKKAWGSYEPQKYEYRIGPNGKLQRSLK